MKRHGLPKSVRSAIVRILPALCIVALSASLGFGADNVRILTLDDALELTLKNNRDIQTAQEYRNKVMGFYVEQRAAAIPQLTATVVGARAWDQAQAAAQSFGPIQTAPNSEDRTYAVSLTQPLFTWGQVGAAIKAAKYGIASADEQIRQYRQAALRDVSAAFYDVLLAKESHTIAVQALRQKEAHADEARRRVTAGVATEYDALAAQVAVDNARPDAIRTENAIRVSREQLRFYLGIPDEVDVAGQLEIPLASPPGYDETLQVAFKRRPELADLRDRLQTNMELMKVYRAGNKPRVDLKASGGYRELSLGHTEFEGKTWSVGLALTFPFFDGFKTKGKVEQAKSDVSTVRIAEAKMLDSIALQIRNAVNKVKESTGILVGLSGTVSQAERLLAMAQKGYEYGIKTHLDVQDAELNLSQAKYSLASARRDYLVAKVTLVWSMGVLGEGEGAVDKTKP